MNQTALAQQLAGVRRLGILGGCFDPIHEAHLNLARKALSEFALDAVLILPLGMLPTRGYTPGRRSVTIWWSSHAMGRRAFFPAGLR